jgi:hypothetical protein
LRDASIELRNRDYNGGQILKLGKFKTLKQYFTDQKRGIRKWVQLK